MCNTCHDLLATSYVLAEAGSSISRRLGDEPAIREFVEHVHQSASVGLRRVCATTMLTWAASWNTLSRCSMPPSWSRR